MINETIKQAVQKRIAELEKQVAESSDTDAALLLSAITEWANNGFNEADMPVTWEELGVAIEEVQAEEATSVQMPAPAAAVEGDVEELMRDALNAFEDQDYTSAAAAVGVVLSIEPGNTDAVKLRRDIERAQDRQRRDARLNELKSLLRRQDVDIKKLDDAVNEADGLLRESKGDDELRDLVEVGRRNRDAKRTAQGAGTTVEAFEIYDELIVSLNDMDAANLRNEENWFDYRADEYRPLSEVMAEFRKQLPVLALQAAQKKIARARDELEKYPGRAVDLLKEARELKGLESGSKSEIDGLLNDATERYSRWQKADKLLEQARKERQTDEIKALQTVREAQRSYPGYPDIEDEVNVFGGAAVNALDLRLNAANQDVRALLAQEANEALQQVTTGKPVAKSVFDRAVDHVRQVEEAAGKIEYDSPRKQEILVEARRISDDIEQIRQRRNALHTLYLKVKQDIDAGRDKRAAENFEQITPDQRNDPVTQYLYSQLQSVLGVDEVIKNIERMLDERQWQQALDRIEEYKSKNEAVERIEELEFEARFGDFREKIEMAWNEEDYLLVKDLVRALEVRLEAGLKNNHVQPDRRERLWEEMGLAQRMEEIERRSTYDEGVGRNFEDINARLKTKGFHFDVLDELAALAEMESNYIGRVRKTHREQGEKLRESALAELSKLQHAGTKDFQHAYELANQLHARNMLHNTGDRKLREWAVIGLYRQREQNYRTDNNWHEILVLWEGAVKEFDSSLELREILKEVRRDCLIFHIEQALADNDWQKVEDYLKDPVSVCVVDKELAYHIDYREDQALDKLNQTARVLQQADELFTQGEYEAAIKSLTDLSQTIGHRQLGRRAIELQEASVQALNQNGNAYLSGKDGKKKDLPRAIELFARASSIDPNDKLSQQRIGDHRVEVLNEIQIVCGDIDELTITMEDVQNQLNVLREKEQKIKNFLAVVGLVAGKEEKEIRRQLQDAQAAMLEIKPKLERARKEIERYAPDSLDWKEVLVRGNWSGPTAAIDQLRNLLPPRHPQMVELENRRRAADQKRNELNDIEERFRIAFQEDAFDEIQQLRQEFMDTLLSVVERPGAGGENLLKELMQGTAMDPYGIVTTNYSIRDSFSAKELTGLDNIFDLAVIRQSNYKQCKEWHDAVEDAYAKAQAAAQKAETLYNTDKRPSYGLAKALDEVVLSCENMARVFRATTLEPQSHKAKGLFENANERMSEIKSWHEKSDRQVKTLVAELKREFQAHQFPKTEIEKDSSPAALMDAVLADIAQTINRRSFKEAEQVVRIGLRYYQAEKTPNRDLLQYFQEVCSRFQVN